MLATSQPTLTLVTETPAVFARACARTGLVAMHCAMVRPVTWRVPTTAWALEAVGTGVTDGAAVSVVGATVGCADGW